MTNARLIVTLAALVAATALAPAASAQRARLTPSGSSKFPERSYVLTLPAGASPTAAGVRVLEDGQPVTRLRVEPAEDRFAVLLVVDASDSMAGAPIGGAMAAARAFADQRPPAQPLGIVTFNGGVDVALPPTTDDAKIDAVLARRPVLAHGTHIYDALIAALKSLPGNLEASAVVLLSDGDDVGSTATLEQALAAASRAHAKLFTIGARSSSFQPGTLTAIAAEGDGEYLGAARAGALEGVYRQLSGELSAVYSINYLSSAPAGTNVDVTAQAGGEQAVTTYASPALHVDGLVRGKRDASAHDTPFLGTRKGAALIALVVLALAFLGIGGVLEQRRRRAALHRRLSQYGAGSRTAPGDPLAIGTFGQDRVERSAWIVKLETDLELARMEKSARRYLLESAGITLAFLLLSVIAGGGILLLLGLVAGPLVSWLRLRHAMARQRALFADQLADAIQSVASAMRTGHSFVGALSQLVETAAEPTASEFRRLVADERLGVPLDVALARIVERMRSKDLKQVALVSVIQRETGGNAAEALDRVVENIRARDDLRRLVRSLTSQGRMAQGVLTALPVGTLIMLRAIGGDTMDPLFETSLGHVMLGLSACMVALGGVWIGRIVKIRV